NQAAQKQKSIAHIADTLRPKCYEIAHHRTTPCDGNKHPCPIKEVMREHKPITLTHDHPDTHGNSHYIELTATPLFNKKSEFIGIIESAKDITNEIYTNKELKRYKDQLHYEEHYNKLTDLPNRILFIDRTEQAIKTHQKSYEQFAVLFLDINNFKAVNDSFGLDVGNKVLSFFANTITKALWEDNTLAHFGSDEFGLIINRIHSHNEVIDLVERLLKLFQEAFMIDEYRIYITFSIGIALYPHDAKSSQALLKNADIALHKAKEDGENNYKFYTQELTDIAIERIILENALRDAIKNDELITLFQPQIDSRENRLIGMETLLRWHHKERGVLTPNHFIPLAEEMKIIDQIDLWVIEHATQKVMEWYNQGYNPGILSINTSIQTLQRSDFKEKLIEILAKNNCPAHYIELEITESQIMKKPESTITILYELQKLGIKISIDDFGTGYSSLAYLKKLPINKLKIDKTFVDDLPQSQEDEAIIKTIIALAATLKLAVIAEGVEKEDQKLFLIDNGCSNIQGYYYYPPLLEAEIIKLLEKPL
ncbi:MAG: EAL domain-containing protein, partial [Campylobacterales bacterium]|nr:EAL domain-containing protein [Campylobacterales bacterium]